MNTRTFALGLILYTCLGCRFLGNSPAPAPEPVAAPNLEAEHQSVKTVQAVEYREPKAVVAAAESAPEEDHLSQAAVCVEKGNDKGALRHLKAHLLAHPDQLMIRIHLAELLFKTHQYPDAQWHFEQFIADAQAVEGPPRNKIVHCHTRLMEIAQIRDDSYAEHLNRGIGFVLLARQFAAGVGEPEPGFHERVLCKAAVELRSAQRARPDEARPYCYLHEVYRKLEQPRPAQRAREKAKALAAFSNLTQTEKQTIIE